jgi:hypothetical protein
LLAAAGIPLNVADRTVVGWTLDLLFILSLSLLPSPKRGRELALMVMATLSTMVVFALERTNPDVLLFMAVLTASLLAEGRLTARLIGYGIALLAALLKYYPITVLIIVFRERITVSLVTLIVGTGVFGTFWLEYHAEIARGISSSQGSYYWDLFSAQNLTLPLAHVAGTITRSPLVAQITAIGCFAALLIVVVSICRRLLNMRELRVVLATLPRRERLLLVIGSAVIAGCFFAGQNVGYRGVYLLLVMPGLLTMVRSQVREVRVVALSTSVTIVLLMWGECLRLALYHVLDQTDLTFFAIGFKSLFWLLRELCWWWTVSLMLAVLADFLSGTPIVRQGVVFLQRHGPRALVRSAY